MELVNGHLGKFRDMSTELFLNFVGVHMDSRKIGDLEFTINRTDLEQVMAGEKSLTAQIEDGTAKVKGDVAAADRVPGDDSVMGCYYAVVFLNMVRAWLQRVILSIFTSRRNRRWTPLNY